MARPQTLRYAIFKLWYSNSSHSLSAKAPREKSLQQDANEDKCFRPMRMA
jgi:hypothetical protein